MALTITAQKLLVAVLSAYKVRFPMLQSISTDFSAEAKAKGQQLIARISKIPTVSDFSGVDQKANAQDSKDLLEDIPVTLSRHREAVITWDQDDLESSLIRLQEASREMSFAIGKDILDFGMSLVNSNNFSGQLVNANPDRAALRAITKEMNANGAADARFGIVNSDVYDSLDADPEITSSDYSGQMQGGTPWGALSNIGGFQNIWEYPDLPANGESLSGFFFDRTALVMAGRAMKNTESVREEMGIPAQAKVDFIQDPESGMPLTAFSWQDNTTFNLHTKLVALYGFGAGKQGGAAGEKTDKGGFRLKSAV